MPLFWQLLKFSLFQFYKYPSHFVTLDILRKTHFGKSCTYDSIVLFKDFDVSAINKLHACHAHLMEWIEEFELPLGHVDEQTGESSHQDFSKFCQGKLMENIHDDRYLENLRKLVVAYASMHRKSKLCF